MQPDKESLHYYMIIYTQYSILPKYSWYDTDQVVALALPASRMRRTGNTTTREGCMSKGPGDAKSVKRLMWACERLYECLRFSDRDVTFLRLCALICCLGTRNKLIVWTRTDQSRRFLSITVPTMKMCVEMT